MWIYTSSFAELRRELLKLPSGTHVKIPRIHESNLKSHLRKTMLGRLKGALEQYRDNNKSKSVHLRVYGDYLEAHLDEKNPIYKPIEHLVKDAPDSLLKTIGLSSLALFALILWLKDRQI